MSNEYPKCVYRNGGGERIWGEFVETRIVDSFDEEVDAASNGWRLHPILADEPTITADVIEPLRRGPGRPRKQEA